MERQPTDPNIIIPIIEEQLHVSTIWQETGRVQVSKFVTEEAVDFSLPVTQEEVVMERKPINQYVDAAPAASRYEGDTLIIPVIKEVLVVEKKLMLVEELHISKRKSEQVVSGTEILRKEAVEITRTNNGPKIQSINQKNNPKLNFMSHTVIGIFKSFTEASVAKQHLENNGFSPSDVDVNDSNYTSSDYSSNDITDDVTDVTAQASTHSSDKKEDESIGGFFRNLFSSDDDDEELTNRHIVAGKRGTVVTVHARSYDEAERAADILDEFGAVNVNDSDDWDAVDSDSNFGRDSANTTTYADMPAGDATPIGGFATNGATDFDNSSLSDIENTTSAGYVQDDDLLNTPRPDSIKVVEENLQVGKEEVRTGGVRLRSRIVERPVEENIRLRQERVTVTRTPVDRPASESDFNTFQEGTVEMTESAEIPVVSKDARVVEEISLNKEVTESDQTIVDTVRHTEVDTENIDPDHKDRNIL